MSRREAIVVLYLSVGTQQFRLQHTNTQHPHTSIYKKRHRLETDYAKHQSFNLLKELKAHTWPSFITKTFKRK